MTRCEVFEDDGSNSEQCFNQAVGKERLLLKTLTGRGKHMNYWVFARVCEKHKR